jgi:hypothetical protein
MVAAHWVELLATEALHQEAWALSLNVWSLHRELRARHLHWHLRSVHLCWFEELVTLREARPNIAFGGLSLE